MNNYVSTEKSLKRWLKSRVKITMATVVGFLIAGTVTMGATADEYKDRQIVFSKAEQSIISSNDFFTNISLTTSQEPQYAIPGIWVQNGAKIELTGKNIGISVNSIVSNQTNGIAAKATNEAAGIIKLGNENTENVTVKIESKDRVIGLASIGNGNNTKGSALLEVNGKNLNITVKSSDSWAYGITSQNSSTTSDPENRAKVIINSENTVVNVEAKDGEGAGLVAMSQGNLEINGNLEVNAETAIVTRGKSSVIINNNNDKTIKLNGDIDFNYDAVTSGTTVESGIILNLSDEDSFLKGKISVTGENIPEDKKEVTGMKLGLSNGGTWEVTGDSFVNDLTMNGGIIEVTDDVEKIDVNKLHGNNGTALFVASVDGEGLTVADGKLNVDSSDGTALDLGLSGVNTDDLAENNISAEKALGELKSKVTGTGAENIDQTLFVDGGTLTGKITAELDSTGNVTNIQQAKETPVTAAIRDLTAINFLSWKQEMSSLSQRMGELRDSSAEHGVWARVYGGKVENGSQYDNKYQTYQVGYDKKYTVDNGRVYLGYLVSYTDGETDYSYGTGENYSVGAGIYATWMNNNGHYIDVLYKVSRLNNKFDMKDVEDVKGDYDTYGISLSAEYGKRFDITDKWFAEPSVGMHLGRLGDETYTTDGGIEVSQDFIYTAEGRIGAAVGYKFSDKGNIYARTHVVKEFAGDVDTEYERNGVYAKTSEDFGDTWFEFGVGVNYRFTENMNVYVDVQKTGEATVDNKWQANLGFRYEF